MGAVTGLDGGGVTFEPKVVCFLLAFFPLLIISKTCTTTEFFWLTYSFDALITHLAWKEQREKTFYQRTLVVNFGCFSFERLAAMTGHLSEASGPDLFGCLSLC